LRRRRSSARTKRFQPDELYPVPLGWAKQAFPRLVYFNRVEKGGHFAAFEQPKLFSEEIRAGFRSLRS
jgi:pimeloyl-ACP methyl ester carboxylesterase